MDEAPAVRAVEGISDADAAKYPLLEYTEENLVRLGVHPERAHFMMQIHRGEIDGDLHESPAKKK